MDAHSNSKKSFKVKLTISCLLVLGFVLLGLFLLFLAITDRSGKAVAPISCDHCNVILISLDTLRADHLGAYGYTRNTSPTIDELADQSMIFHNSFVNAYFTLPSHMSIFTSTYPTRHKLNYQRYDTAKPENTLLSEDIQTITQIMNKSGHRAVWIAPFTDPHLELQRGFERGFWEFHESLFTLQTENITLLRSYFDNFFREINEPSNGSFFWFLHSYAIHSPYIQPPSFLNTFAGKDYNGRLPDTYQAIFETELEKIKRLMDENSTALKDKLAIDNTSFSRLESIVESRNASALTEYRLAIGRPIFERAIGYPGITYYDAIRNNITDNDIAQLNDRYDAGIYYMDFQLGLFFDELKKAGLWDKTVIVITSDHGEELYEHKGFDHTNFYDHTIRVPLIIHVPGMEGRKDIYELTQSIDIMPTILGVLGIDTPQSAQGKNMIAVLEGNEEPNEYVYGFSRGNMYIRSKEWKYLLRNNGQEELYYLPEDPLEKQNLINTSRQDIIEEQEHLRERLQTWSEDFS